MPSGSPTCSTLEIDEPAVLVGHSFGGGVAIKLAHDMPSRVRSLVLVNSIGGSAWRSGRTLRSAAERPLWDWGLHFPGDVWPMRQATRVLPVVFEDLLPNLLRNPRAIVKVANLARRADLRAELERLRDRGIPITILWASRDGIIPRVVRGVVRCLRCRREPSSTDHTAGCSPTRSSSAR